MDSARLRPEVSLAPIASAIACAAMSSLVTGANSTHQARPPNRACNCAATASASLLLPTPPGPISVTRRLESRAAVTPSHSLRRPISAVTGAGMPERRVTVSPGAVSPGLGAVPGPPEMAWLGSMGKLWHCAGLAAPGGASGPAYRVIRWHCPAGDLGLGLAVAVFRGI